MKRSELLTIIEAALAAGQTRYAREAALALLAAWPGDLSGRMALARAHLAAEDRHETMAALDLLEGVVAVDPERAEAQRALGAIFHQAGQHKPAQAAFAAAHTVDGLPFPAGVDAPAWAAPGRAARLALERDDWTEALAQAEQAVQAAPDAIVPSLLLLLCAWRQGTLDLALPLAEGLHARWPGCIAFSLCLAECLLAAGKDGAAEAQTPGENGAARNVSRGGQNDETRAILLLHEAGALDPAGEVVRRYWGATHPYRSLWPQAPDPELPGPLPREVAALLGRNVLNAPGAAKAGPAAAAAGSSGRRPAPAPKPARPAQAASGSGEAAEILAELQRLEAQLKPAPRRKSAGARKEQKRGAPAQARFSAPADPLSTHLILASRARLIHKFGQEQAAAVFALLDELADASAASSGAAVVVVYVDDRDGLRAFDLRPVDASRPWEIKLLLKDLAAAIAAKGGRLASVLIAGGDDVVPFHRLPNPVDDADGDVPSDNPYASSDENYLVPEWAVGRLPTPAGRDPAAFTDLLRAAIRAHRALAVDKRAKTIAGLPGLFERLARWLASLFRRPAGPLLSSQNFGYAARAWQAASEAVFAAIGDQRRLNTCPPLDVTGLPPEGLHPAPLAYFNLHGVEDGPEWYGQRDADDNRLPLYPIALRPANVANSGRAPALVFSEACYGANIQSKQVEDALCLKFLASGTQAVIGSTKIAYGSIGTPLIGADLLGRLFWDNLAEGQTVGEALRLAKIGHAREMHARQGYLDGEDQKTLVSFVLYGDPLLPGPGAASKRGSAGRAKARLATRPSGDELTLTTDEAGADPGVSRPEAVARIKSLVERHLPGRDDWAVQIAQQRRVAAGSDPAQQGAPGGAKSFGPRTGNMVFTLSKTLPIDVASRRALSQYVRVTVNAEGKVIKMAVSR